MANMQAIVEEVFQQTHAAGAQALKDGVAIVLPQYLDAAEIEALEMNLYLLSQARYKITHHLGERRIWVQQKPGGRAL